MGIFDGILICSDLDGTFESEKKYPLPQRNIDAIKYFTKNGGYFSFCTGRLASHLEERGLSELVNAPVCIVNGGIVYDFEKRCNIKVSPLPNTVNEIVYMLRSCIQDAVKLHYSFECQYLEIFPPFDVDCNVTADKVVFTFENEQDADDFLKIASEHLDGYYISKSWSIGVELNSIDATKGTAIEFIKEYVGAHTSYGIGNYGNDLPLLEHADVGVAVSNASDEIKAAADMIVCDYMHDSIADLIDKIEQNLKNSKL